MSLFGSGRREGLLAVLTLLLLAIAVHAPGLFAARPRALDPQLTSAGQLTAESATNRVTLEPALAAAGRVWRDGELPLWNPSAQFGEPFWSSGAPVLYPPFWLLMVDGAWANLEFLLCLHAFLACMLMYRLCRVISLSRYVAWFSGAIYGLGWFFNSQLDRLPQAAATALLPLALEFTWRLLVSRKRHIYAAWLAVVLLLMFTTGGTASAVVGTMLCVAMFACRVWALDPDARRQAAFAALVTTGLAVMLCAPLWLRWLTHLGAMQGSATGTPHHLQLAGLLGFLCPTALSRLDTDVPQAIQLVNAGADALELVLFPGTCVLFLAAVGFLRPKRSTRGLFWLCVFGVGLLLSMDSPLTEALAAAEWIPSPFTGWPPGTALVLVHVALAILAGIALENFFEAPQARRFAVPTAAALTIASATVVFAVMFVVPDLGRSILRQLLDVPTRAEVQVILNHLRFTLLPTLLFAAAIAGLFLAWRRLGMLRFKVALQVLVAANLLLVGLAYTPRHSTESATGRLAHTLPTTPGRTLLHGRQLHGGAVPGRQQLALHQVAATNRPSLASVSPTILARTHDFLTVLDPAMVEISSKVTVLPVQTTPQASLLEIAGIGNIIAAGAIHVPGYHPLAAAPAFDARLSAVAKVHVRDRPVTRARLVFECAAANSAAEATEQLQTRTRADQLSQIAIIEQPPAGFACQAPSGDPRVEIVEDRANRVTVKVDTAGGRGYLLLADAFAPGWQARLDGKSVPIHPADVAMRAVAVPAGHHEVTFEYRPTSLVVGVPIALFGILLWIGWLIWSSRTR